MFATVEKSPAARLWMYPERSLWRFAGQSLYWPWSPFSGQTLGSLLMIWETRWVSDVKVGNLLLGVGDASLDTWKFCNLQKVKQLSCRWRGSVVPSLANAAEHTLTSLATTWVGNVSKDVAEEIVLTNFPNLSDAVWDTEGIITTLFDTDQ